MISSCFRFGQRLLYFCKQDWKGSLIFYPRLLILLPTSSSLSLSTNGFFLGSLHYAICNLRLSSVIHQKVFTIYPCWLFFLPPTSSSLSVSIQGFCDGAMVTPWLSWPG